jgi:hypothetical protein
VLAKQYNYELADIYNIQHKQTRRVCFPTQMCSANAWTISTSGFASLIIHNAFKTVTKTTHKSNPTCLDIHVKAVWFWYNYFTWAAKFMYSSISGWKSLGN